MHLGIIRQGLVAVSESFRYQKCTPVIGIQLGTVPLATRIRVGSQVDCHVEERPAGTADYLCLCVRLSLQVHPAQRTSKPVERDVCLNHGKFETGIFELLTAETPGKRASIILDEIELQEV